MHESRSVSLQQLLGLNLSFRALVVGARAICTTEAEILRAQPRYALAIPGWGMGEGIAIFAQTEGELVPHLTHKPPDEAATLYRLDAF